MIDCLKAPYMRTYFYLAFWVLISTPMYAQDTLYRDNGVSSLVTILEVNHDQVKYKLFSNPEGPMYVLSKAYIDKIVYASGWIEEFPGTKTTTSLPVAKVDPRTTDFGRNFISFDLFDLGSGSITLGYERIFKSGYSSIKLPISFAIPGPGRHYVRPLFAAGLEYNLYPTGQGTIRFLYGPAFEYKRVEYLYSDHDKGCSYAFLGQVGVLHQQDKHFNCSLTFGFGYARIIQNDNYGSFTENQGVARVQLNLGYKF